MSAVTIEPMDTGDHAVEAWLEVQRACRAADAPDTALPSAARVRGDLEHPWPGAVIELWAARQAGRTVGVLTVGMRVTENTDLVVIRELSVHPEHRRAGIGRRLWKHTESRARAEGRDRILAETSRPIGQVRSPGEPFAAAMGARQVTVEIRRQLRIADIDDADLRRRLEATLPASRDYSLVHWVGATPAEYVDAMAVMAARMTTDVPMDDLDWQPEVWDADRIRARDAVMAARGNRSYTTAARHDPTGMLAGYTVLDLPSGNDEHAWQQDTLVVPAHRGHRLGLRLKIKNLNQVRAHEPALAVVDTWNAVSNPHMVDINVALGFQPASYDAEWELVMEEQR